MQSNWDTLRAQIAYFSKPFPSHAIVFANEHRDELAPQLVEVLARVAADPSIVIDDPDYILHEYAMYLLATWADTRAYAPLIALGHQDEDTLDAVLGDSVTETFDRCLASVCDGDLAPLKALFEDTQASFWARGAALDAMVVRVLAGDDARDALVQYLLARGDLEAQRLRSPGVAHANLEAIDCIVGAACDLAAVELHSRIQSWFDDSLLDPMVRDRAWVDGRLQESFEALRQRLLARGKTYVRDVEAEMGWWAAFCDQPVGAKTTANVVGSANAFDRIPRKPSETVVRSAPKVGRNDPCPCGSGKKYKKCCGAS